MLKDAYCPLILNLGFDVEYELIARVLYHGSADKAATAVGHCITQTRIGDRCFVHNDPQRDGLLAELGPLSLMESIDTTVVTITFNCRSTVSKSCLLFNREFNIQRRQPPDRSQTCDQTALRSPLYLLYQWLRIPTKESNGTRTCTTILSAKTSTTIQLTRCVWN